jgi:hypothetical protein
MDLDVMNEHPVESLCSLSDMTRSEKMKSANLKVSNLL